MANVNIKTDVFCLIHSPVRLLTSSTTIYCKYVILHYWDITVFLPEIHWKYTQVQCVGFTPELLHHVLPAESFLWLPWPSAPTTHFQSCAPVRPFFNLAGRTSPPHRSLLLNQTFPHQSTCFPLSLSLHATQGNDSITYDPIHLLMMFGHSKGHLRLTQSSSHSLCSPLGVSMSWVKQQGSAVR